MKITPKTKVAELLNKHPFLIDFLVKYNPKFELLKNKVARATMGRVASLAKVAVIGDVPLDKLIQDIANAIWEETGQAVQVEGGTEVDDDKKEQLKAIILDLHQGAPFEDVKSRFDELIADVEAIEIATMEQELIHEGLPAEEVRRLCDLHVGVFEDSLKDQPIPEMPEGHPVHTFIEENNIFTTLVGQFNALLRSLEAKPDEPGLSDLQPELEKTLKKLGTVDTHYTRKENQLFPFLEKHGITGPPQVMWGVHDDTRAQLKKVQGALEFGDRKATIEQGLAFTKMVADMVFKENHILFAMSLETLDEAEWIQIRHGEPDIGYALFTPTADWPSDSTIRPPVKESTSKSLTLDTGSLSVEQVNLMLKHLPLDITFVDQNDQVRYFSATDERIFPRSPGIIGRKVQNCHPPSSVGTVEKIVTAFRSGKKDSSEFWFTMNGRFIHIRYFAVRDSAGTYKGTMEVSQDLTELKTLDGERRLLDWEIE